MARNLITKRYFKQALAGFTLLELYMVMAIIVFLAIGAFYAYLTNLKKSYDSKRKTDLYTITQALEEYEKDNESYPASPLPACNTSTASTPLERYIGRIPCDPKTGTDYGYEVGPTVSNRVWFKAYALLEVTGDSDIAKLGCSGGCGPGGAYNFFESSPNAP